MRVKLPPNTRRAAHDARKNAAKAAPASLTPEQHEDIRNTIVTTLATLERETIDASQLAAAFVLDAPIPIRRLIGLYGSRSTFWKWEKDGLPVRTVEGLGASVVPSQFKNYLLKKFGTINPAEINRS
ncbi:hypothetical protein [Geminisphaera colitermitum]|uniref:hypothetical protein n=1 Tax=Geminisphaera colitermitum TaxID=1148786 RepID=UPI00019652D0|nr:hypothetical protein [Geminisphaera colitermitum]